MTPSFPAYVGFLLNGLPGHGQREHVDTEVRDYLCLPVWIYMKMERKDNLSSNLALEEFYAIPECVSSLCPWLSFCR